MRMLVVSALIVVCDQVTKLLVKGFSVPILGLQVEGMKFGTSRPILGDFLRLTFVENPGMAFGIDLGGKLFFSIFTLLASVAIFIYFLSMKSTAAPYRFSLAMILGGAFGNLIDRVFYAAFFNEGPLFYGKVVDFIDVDFFNINLFGYQLSRWPVFNIADASVTVGVILMLFVHRSVQEEISPSAEAAGLSSPDPGNGEQSELSLQDDISSPDNPSTPTQL